MALYSPEISRISDCSTLGLYHCSDCDFSTDLFIVLKQHRQKCVNQDFRKVETVIKTYFCENCGFCSHFLINWLKHVLNYHPGTLGYLTPKDFNQFKCDFYDYKSKYKGCVKKHRIYCNLKASQEKTHWFDCDKCDYKTKSRKYFKRHKISKHLKAKEIKWFRCGICGYKSTHNYSLKQHLKNRHLKPEEITWFGCEKCNFKTKYKSHLTRHETKHGRCSKAIQRLKCDTCKYETSEVKNLVVHKKNHFLNPEEYPWFECKKCAYKTQNKRCFLNHVDEEERKTYWEKPTDVKNIPKSQGRAHTKKHETYKCDRCDYKTKNEAYLKEHVACKHLKAEEIQWFEEKGSLDKHRVFIHFSGPDELKQWFECGTCGYKTKDIRSSKTHVKSKH